MASDEILESKRLIWAFFDELENVPPRWFTLEHLGALAEWVEVLEDDFELDDEAIGNIVGLCSQGKLGCFEANRVLYHLMKDSEQGPRDTPAAWVHRTTEESREAMMDWALWEYWLEDPPRLGPQRHQGQGKGHRGTGWR